LAPAGAAASGASAVVAKRSVRRRQNIRFAPNTSPQG
jgi:hypothetical protein